MKDSSKLFISALALFFISILKGVTPTVINHSFDIGGFIGIFFLSMIVAVLGLVKYLSGK